MENSQILPGNGPEPIILPRDSAIPLPAKRPSWTRIGLAFAVAAVSDILAFWAEFVPPAQWVLDAATAFALFLLMGRRWALVPGLVAEAIPGMGVFPVWVLVVASILAYDGIRRPAKA